MIITNAVLAAGFFAIGYFEWNPTADSGDTFVAICFIAFIASVLPFLITYTKLGLNHPEGEPEAGPEVENNKKMAELLPDWKYSLPISILAMMLLAPLLGLMYSFMCCGNLLSLYWFARAHSAAEILPKETKWSRNSEQTVSPYH